jgi:hypothetical protein
MKEIVKVLLLFCIIFFFYSCDKENEKTIKDVEIVDDINLYKIRESNIQIIDEGVNDKTINDKTIQGSGYKLILEDK